MDDIIDDLTKIPLSGDDLIDIATSLGADKSKLAWITYNSLQSIDNINQLFKNGSVNSVFILFTPPMTNVGHWVLLGNNRSGLFFMDPYGLSIEEDIKITKANDKLLQLLMGYNIDVNKFQYQKFGTDHGSEVNTCGRWVAIRAFMFWATNQQFQNIVEPVVKRKQVDSLDTFANLLTAFLSMSDKVVETFLMKK